MSSYLLLPDDPLPLPDLEEEPVFPLGGAVLFLGGELTLGGLLFLLGGL
jgi:hypothetical protein